MFGDRMMVRVVQIGAMSLALMLSGAAWADQVDLAGQVCADGPHWSDTEPAINLAHVFCGEVKSNGRAAGFHARPGGVNPATITSVEITQPANTSGVYAGMVTFAKPDASAGASSERRDPVKFSSIFPDSCSFDQIVASILSAHDNRTDCPAGSPGWWQCGLNRPKDAALSAGLCVGDDPDGVFTIAIGLLRDGRINTAFPLR
ncbi:MULTISPECIES: EndoU domain-containing protein [Thalassospira]|uniref:EndoU domain-containing protein n=1 Tax=Thalassospira aquimaris TaxID=3037796 RepID=A0ABT6GHH5_9PROT|nr:MULTISPECIES: EndoU domain-containing protein [Thalassospira]MDG4721513.1 EndoU domain-containing protein [Thalassospira sp. FZY0004]